ncbi:MAG: hypothetical protein YK1309IOTA_1370005, partial [Marine Group I thaumarchaeote]
MEVTKYMKLKTVYVAKIAVSLNTLDKVILKSQMVHRQFVSNVIIT